MMQDVNGIKFEGKIPKHKFDDLCCDYEEPFKKEEILKKGNYIRVRGAKFDEKLNSYDPTQTTIV